MKHSQRGMVTVEIAFASLIAAAVAVGLAWTLTVLMLQVRCADVATAVARQEARGDREAVTKILSEKPSQAQVEVRGTGDQVVVTVKLLARPWADWLPGVPLTASATVIREPA